MTGNNVPQPDERLRAQRCLELRREGHTWQEIADQLGYADRSGARKAVERLLDRTEFESVDEYRVLESDRLDALHAAYWTAALAGDLDAAKLVLRISAQRCRLLGLDLPARVSIEPGPAGEDFAVTAARLMTEIMDADARTLPDFLTSDPSSPEVESEPWSNIGK
ncbi:MULTISPECIES: hypothetical protein [Rhodococcus]|uniref:hypothetical protein n=1 Tax=Rhodococcus TaxID=1827 RepID=UPI001E4F6BED|nr:hypothetical protein [Rhodococcus pyridinivorans]MCD2116737.1 hypothetical protein [Rhodococcus pyridinivorans]MCZ4626055.1 hypothetical protein [Rhodococcus pyridinivorans]MCZ4647010.1 hypothetical protein [Rhodococcus pyridinivorans]MDJ0484233.1 hypothetical protein [Rhodococcus pyridinivorans]MDV7253114.1 hypothetical protein [Rhodococcus pyridinivorans]